MTDKTKPEGIGSKNRVTGDDDVEGHAFRHASTTEPEGIGSKNRVTGEPEGIGSKNRVTGDDDDVEGHQYARTTEPDGISSKNRVTGEPDGISSKNRVTGGDDVEGHSLLDPFAARELARARERDVQQHAKRHEFERDARDAKKDRS